MTHPLHDQFVSYRQFVTTTWSKPPQILQELISNLTETQKYYADLEPNEELAINKEEWESTKRSYNKQALFILDQINQLRACQLSFNLQHVAIGLQGEALEIYLEDDLKEELGDILYYLTQACNFLDVTTYDVLHVVTKELTTAVSDPNSLIKPLMQNIEILCNMLKKVYIYGQPLETHIVGIKHHILNCYALIGGAHPFQSIMSENREKLEKRYSAGFSTQASIERADKCVD